jgi:hypothetical protein
MEALPESNMVSDIRGNHTVIQTRLDRTALMPQPLLIDGHRRPDHLGLGLPRSSDFLAAPLHRCLTLVSFFLQSSSVTKRGKGAEGELSSTAIQPLVGDVEEQSANRIVLLADPLQCDFTVIWAQVI